MAGESIVYQIEAYAQVETRMLWWFFDRECTGVFGINKYIEPEIRPMDIENIQQIDVTEAYVNKCSTGDGGGKEVFLMSSQQVYLMFALRHHNFVMVAMADSGQNFMPIMEYGLYIELRGKFKYW